MVIRKIDENGMKGWFSRKRKRPNAAVDAAQLRREAIELAQKKYLGYTKDEIATKSVRDVTMALIQLEDFLQGKLKKLYSDEVLDNPNEAYLIKIQCAATVIKAVMYINQLEKINSECAEGKHKDLNNEIENLKSLKETCTENPSYKKVWNQRINKFESTRKVANIDFKLSLDDSPKTLWDNLMDKIKFD